MYPAVPGWVCFQCMVEWPGCIKWKFFDQQVNSAIGLTNAGTSPPQKTKTDVGSCTEGLMRHAFYQSTQHQTLKMVLGTEFIQMVFKHFNVWGVRRRKKWKRRRRGGTGRLVMMTWWWWSWWRRWQQQLYDMIMMMARKMRIKRWRLFSNKLCRQRRWEHKHGSSNKEN